MGARANNKFNGNFQQKFSLPKPAKAYGGELSKTRKGRLGPRPLATRQGMHLVLRSSLAKGIWSFRRPENKSSIDQLIKKFSLKYGVRVFSYANVGNHIHLHIQLSNRSTYPAYIRALTASIAMAVTGMSRWKTKSQLGFKKFWDQRPFSRVLAGFSSVLKLKDYIEINRLQGDGVPRVFANNWIKTIRSLKSGP